MKQKGRQHEENGSAREATEDNKNDQHACSKKQVCLLMQFHKVPFDKFFKLNYSDIHEALKATKHKWCSHQLE